MNPYQPDALPLENLDIDNYLPWLARPMLSWLVMMAYCKASLTLR